MFHLGGTVLNNTRLVQVYLYLFKHYTLLVKTTTVCFISLNFQVVTRKLKYIVICGEKLFLYIYIYSRTSQYEFNSLPG